MPSLDSHPSLPLSVAQVRLLLQVALPQPVLDLPAALALIAYQQRHNYAALLGAFGRGNSKQGKRAYEP